MEYTVTRSTGFFSRLGSSFGGIILGLVLFVAGSGLLWWNEGDFVKTRDALNEARGEAEELVDLSRVDASLDGRLVHATGLADTRDVLRDPEFGLGGRGIAFERRVEFYQWTENSRTEKRQTLGGGEETVTTYSYARKWVGYPVDSNAFHAPEARSVHANNVLLKVDSLTRRAVNVSFGAYRLPPFLVAGIGGRQPFAVSLDPAVRERLSRQLLRAWRGTGGAVGNWWDIGGGGLRHAGTPQLVHESGNCLYLGASPATPEVGDVRLTFNMTPPARISLIARAKGDTFEAFRASNGKEVSALSMGDVSMDAMFAEEHSDNVFMTWVVRIFGTVLVVAGLRLVMAPLVVIASIIPLLGSIVGAGTGLVSLLLGLAWSLCLMAVAWLRFRPAIGGIMLAVAAGFLLLLYAKGRARTVTPQTSGIR
ncbi:MAG: TMEM43 family protein [Desulfovibrio sp.]|nr:TMEM43 family protein [Desulfovibrio sp.]